MLTYCGHRFTIYVIIMLYTSNSHNAVDVNYMSIKLRGGINQSRPHSEASGETLSTEVQGGIRLYFVSRRTSVPGGYRALWTMETSPLRSTQTPPTCLTLQLIHILTL